MPVAGGQPLRRPREGQPAVLVEPLVQVEGHDGPVLTADTLALQGGADHPRIVEHERVARPKEVRQIADLAVFE